ncbi:MAG TPA: hypothetical protein VGM69_23035 [Chloroflexota bacterium]|jgi:hypothetical protein
MKRCSLPLGVLGRPLSGAVHQMLELDPRDRFPDAGRALVKIRQRGTEVYSPDLLGELIFPDGRRLAMRRHDREWIPT